jgi:hypothetical protein
MASGKTAAKSKLAEGAPLKIAGSFINDVLLRPSSAISLVTTIGESDTASFVVPFAYLSILEAKDGEMTELLSAFVPLESTAYLVADMTTELASAVEQLGDMTSAKLPFEPTRLKAMRGYVDNARKSLDGLTADLDRLIAAAGS